MPGDMYRRRSGAGEADHERVRDDAAADGGGRMGRGEGQEADDTDRKVGESARYVNRWRCHLKLRESERERDTHTPLKLRK